jgi:hypothetical protein
MSNTQVVQKELTYKQKLDRAMLQLFVLIDEQYEDHVSIQNAYNALACALDEEHYKDPA